MGSLQINVHIFREKDVHFNLSRLGCDAVLCWISGDQQFFRCSFQGWHGASGHSGSTKSGALLTSRPWHFAMAIFSFSLASACGLSSTFLLMCLPILESYPAVCHPSQRPSFLLRILPYPLACFFAITRPSIAGKTHKFAALPRLRRSTEGNHLRFSK